MWNVEPGKTPDWDLSSFGPNSAPCSSSTAPPLPMSEVALGALSSSSESAPLRDVLAVPLVSEIAAIPLSNWVTIFETDTGDRIHMQDLHIQQGSTVGQVRAAIAKHLDYPPSDIHLMGCGIVPLDDKLFEAFNGTIPRCTITIKAPGRIPHTIFNIRLTDPAAGHAFNNWDELWHRYISLIDDIAGKDAAHVSNELYEQLDMIDTSIKDLYTYTKGLSDVVPASTAFPKLLESLDQITAQIARAKARKPLPAPLPRLLRPTRQLPPSPLRTYRFGDEQRKR